MQKHIFGRKFKRDVNERRALFKGLASSLVLQERIKTTEEKAKAIRPEVEKLITKAKRTTDTRHAYAVLQPHLNALAVKKVILDVAPRFQSRNGGYTRIIKIGNRFSDNASMVVIELVEKAVRADAVVGKGKQAKSSADRADAAVAAALYGGKEKKEKTVKGKEQSTKSPSKTKPVKKAEKPAAKKDIKEKKK
jgi:large subunit ribosomal protein L17